MQILKINGRLPGYNDYQRTRRGNKYAAAKEKADIEQMIGWSIKRQKLRPETAPCLFVFEWHEINKKKSRDPDNIAFAKKFIFDRLVGGHILKNDTPAQVVGFSDCFYYDGRQGVTVYIIPENERVAMERFNTQNT